MNAAPTLPTLETTEEGVEKMPVPMMRPMLDGMSAKKENQEMGESITSKPLSTIIQDGDLNHLLLLRQEKVRQLWARCHCRAGPDRKATEPLLCWRGTRP